MYMFFCKQNGYCRMHNRFIQRTSTHRVECNTGSGCAYKYTAEGGSCVSGSPGHVRGLPALHVVMANYAADPIRLLGSATEVKPGLGYFFWRTGSTVEWPTAVGYFESLEALFHRVERPFLQRTSSRLSHSYYPMYNVFSKFCAQNP